MNDDSDLPGTGFQIHAKLDLEGRGLSADNVIDFTERRLLMLFRKTTNMKLRSKILKLIKSYQTGNVTIAWSAGQPMFHEIASKKNRAKTESR